MTGGGKKTPLKKLFSRGRWAVLKMSERESVNGRESVLNELKRSERESAC